MIKEQKINRRIALGIVNSNIQTLKNSKQTIESIYRIIFSHPNFEFLDVITNYGVQEITYGEAQKAINGFAHYFRENLKISGKYIGIYLENSKEWIYSFFGLLVAGFSPVLLSTANGIEDIKLVKSKLQIEYVITNKDVGGVEVNVINPFELKNLNTEDKFDNEFGNEIVMLTSGSTGTSKIVFYNGEELCNQIYNAQRFIKEDKNIEKSYHGALKHLVILPFYHIFGLVAVLLWFSFFNRTFVLPTGLTPRDLKRACRLTKPSHIFAVPAFYESIYALINAKVDTKRKARKLKHAFSVSYFLQKCFGSYGTHLVRDILLKKYLKQIFGTSIRYCISGGAFLDPNTLKTINLIGYPLVNGYGSTEIGITSLCVSNKIKERMIQSIGKPFEFVEYKIEDASLLVRSPSLSKHIIDKDRDLLLGKGEFTNTFDIAKVENGKYFLLGRSDEVIIGSNGENISIPLIENKLSLPLASEFAIVENDKKLVLIASYNKTLSIDNVIKELQKVSKSKQGAYIRNIYYTNRSFEKANLIKIKRDVLLKTLLSNPNDFIALESLQENTKQIEESLNEEVCNQVIKAFKKIFPERRVNKNTNFYHELGGDSLRYFVLIGEVEKEVGKKLDIDYKNPPLTPEEFTKVLVEQQK